MTFLGKSVHVLLESESTKVNSVDFIIINHFRPIITDQGLWDQVRVDCGREFALLLFVQRLLSQYRRNTAREPFLQTRSTQVDMHGFRDCKIYDCDCVVIIVQNHLAERHWVEVNSRVNFPIKRALVNMQQNSVIDMDCPVTKYCVSFIAGKLCQVGIQRHIQAWNNHRIPGIIINNNMIV